MVTIKTEDTNTEQGYIKVKDKRFHLVIAMIDYSEYPPDWWKRRERILKRAGNRCEWCGAENKRPHPVTGSKVVLTIAHLDHDHDNWDVADDRLAALCQRCHLNYDRPRHINKRKYGRKYDGPQQLKLF